jgi:hypothetical protein
MWKAIHGIGNDRLKKLHRASSGNLSARGKPRGMGAIGLSGNNAIAVKRDRCIVFWRQYFNQHCQRPNDHTLLWPNSSTYADIKERFFEPWWAEHYPGEDSPGRSCFEKARHDPQFADVKVRIKHFHLKCDQCALYSKMFERGFTTREEEESWSKLRVDHEVSYRHWRQTETSLMQEASHSPDKLTLIRCDDTISVQFPHPGSRQWKGLSQMKGFEVVPWCVEDVSRGVREYVYTPKRLQPHGANRFCTLLHTVLQANRSCGGPAAKARRLVIIVDNYGENRNYCNFAFLSEVVMAGWYDSIELLFGPVGHTHNGVDAIHHKHNVEVGKYFAGTLAHYIHNYGLVFKSPVTRPSASLCLIQYDWDEHYRNSTVKLSGINERHPETGALLSVGFKIARHGNDPLVRVYYTHDTCMTPRWIGVDRRQPGGEGFVCLARRPSAPPRLIEQHRTARNDAVLKWVNHKKLAEQVMANGEYAGGCLDWVRDAATTGMVPVNTYLDEQKRVPDGRMGTPARIGVVGVMEVDVDIIVGYANGATNEQFWKVAGVQSVPRTLLVEGRPIQRALRYSSRRNVETFALADAQQSGDDRHDAIEADVGSVGGQSEARSESDLEDERRVTVHKVARKHIKPGQMRYHSSDTDTSAMGERSRRRAPRTVPRGRRRARTKASECVEPGTKVYVVDKLDDDGPWGVTKGVIHERKKVRGRKRGYVYMLQFNNYAEKFEYPRADFFLTRAEAKIECSVRDSLEDSDSAQDDN